MELKNIQIIWKMQNKKCLKNKIFLPCLSSVKVSDPGDFLKAQFVIFRCQKYVKKGYIKMRKRIYLVPLKSVLGCSILHYSHFSTKGEYFFCGQKIDQSSWPANYVHALRKMGAFEFLPIYLSNRKRTFCT